MTSFSKFNAVVYIINEKVKVTSLYNFQNAVADIYLKKCKNDSLFKFVKVTSL